MTAPAPQPKRVALLCTADLQGGAAIVTFRLMEALRAEGVDARMVVARKMSTSPFVDSVDGRRFKVAKLAERGEIFLCNGFNRTDLWKVSTARFGCGVTEHPWVREADTVILSWVNQGLVSLADIRRLHSMGKKLLWVMHDMWCATGVCHHATDCRAYLSTCQGCRLLHTKWHRTDLSTRTQRAKQRLYAEVPVTFVPVSNWLADRCRESSLLRDAEVVTIPNPFPIHRYSTTPTLSREELGLPPEAPVILFAAARIDDPIKNLPLAVATLNLLVQTHPQAVAVFCGALRDPQALSSLRLRHIHLGPVTDPERMAALYAHATAVLSTSVRETLPGTLIEGMAAGATPVTTGHGGQADIIAHGIDGFIADPSTPLKELPGVLAFHLHTALTSPFPREEQHSAVARRFAPDAVAHSFIQLLK